jgi:glycosyltransferase involved in cell wall biosynthesis
MTQSALMDQETRSGSRMGRHGETGDSSRRTISLIIICRNEEAGVRAVVPRIDRSLFDDIFAVDGNSKDNTIAALKEFGIRAYTQKRRGLGAAMMDGREHCQTDAFIYFHADGNENPDDLPRMVQLLRGNQGAPGARFVVASRHIKGATNEDDGKFLKFRKWANLGFAMAANICFAKRGNKTTDVTNGFRGISCEAYDAMCLTSEDLTMDYQMVIRALKRGIPITEFPTHEGQRVAGATNFASIPTGIAELKLLMREWWQGESVFERAGVDRAAELKEAAANA